MKKLLLIIKGVFISQLLMAQLSIKQGNILVYNVNDFDGQVEQLISFESLTPDLKISWNKKNKYDDKGTFVIKNSAKEFASNIVFNYPLGANNDELSDVLLGFMVSKKMFTELKTTKKSKIRIDCNVKSEDLNFKSIQPMNIKIGGKTQTVNCINASWGTFGDEIWILDNAEMPIVVKVSAVSKFELIEIK